MEKFCLLTDYRLLLKIYIETVKLSNESSNEVIHHIKSIFARHGIPQEVVSDNGPQYSSLEYKKFANEYGFLHTTSSPKFPQSNGKAEKADRTVKNLLKKSQDPYMAMLTYQSSPLWNGFSPPEMLISRQLHANLPMTHTQLLPSVPDFAMLKAKEEEQRMKQKSTFDCRHAVQDLDPLLPGEQVWVTDHNTTGNVVEPTSDIKNQRFKNYQ